MLILKKCVLPLLLVSLLTLPVSAENCRAAAWVLYHPESGTILAGENTDTPLPMASTTKIMTALLVLENCDLYEKVVIPEKCTGIEGSSMYLRVGESCTVEELLLGLMLSSGNDAACALAVHTSGSEEAFVAAMNARAAELGLSSTHFENPHGLPAEGHCSSARDLAVLMGEAMKNPDFRRITGTKSAEIHGVTLQNHNKLLWQCEGVIGGKTGYTRAAGRCLVSVCSREGMELVCVTLNDRDDWEDHAALYEEAFAVRKLWQIRAGEILSYVSLIGKGGAAVSAGEDCSLCIGENESVSVELRVPRFVFGTPPQGEQAGEAVLRWSGGEKRLPLVWAADEERTECECRNTFLRRGFVPAARRKNG